MHSLRRPVVQQLQSLVVFLLTFFSAGALAAQWTEQDVNGRQYYKEPSWKPRAILPAEDSLRGDFWAPSPHVPVTYNDPGFAEDTLGKVPAPGIHPRVLLNPSDVERIRSKLALGDKAPAPFRVMWQRVARSRSAFYALVYKDNKLGKELAGELAVKIKALEPKLDALDQRPDRDNLWVAERSTIASGDPNPPTEIWDLLDYDYLAGWMTAEECESARRVIARLIAHRISNFMTVPDHFMINNHQGFGMEYIRLMLLIEGEKGFDQRVYDRAAQKARAMLDWYLDADGMCYESIKGWLNVSAFVAVGQRQRDLLKHDHLRAKMRFFQAAARWEDGAWKIRDEMRASAFHVIWMMHYYHPKDEGIDFLYRATLTTHSFLTDADAKWPSPVGIAPELLLLYADDGITDAKGQPQDWSDQARIDGLHLPLTWQDNQRGYVESRNSWRKDDLHVGFACKQDFFYGGHEGSENGRFILWRDGVNWVQDTNMLATKATFLQNMLTVDGQGLHWPPSPGTWLGVHESTEGIVAACDGKDGYSFTKVMQVHPLDFPSAKLPYYAPFAEGNYDLTRDEQIAFNPRTVAWNDGAAHTDYGPWSGETRLVENYKSWNPMKRAYRTVHLARGTNPYVLVLDDAQKDSEAHGFEWNITVPAEAELIDAETPEVVFQNTEPSHSREDDLLLGLNGTARDPKTGKYVPKKGDPLCLVRVLWRKSDYGFPVPRLEKFQGFNHLVIPAHSVSPEFRILIYPYRQGDPLPKTAWNRDRSELTVKIGEQTDAYHFGLTDGGRTVFAMARNEKQILASEAPPARPVIAVRGGRFDASDLRYTREDGKPPVYLVDGKTQVRFERVPAPGAIRYTLDGSDPSEQSPLYQAPLEVSDDSKLKACVFDPQWPCGAKKSEVLTAEFKARKPAPGLPELSATCRPGLLAGVYELKTVMWNDRGFFDAQKVMMPDIRKQKPLQLAATDRFTLPHVVPALPAAPQSKGFYRFNGWFHAAERGVYEFAVNSCGPVTLDVGNQTAIEVTGIFHQQQSIRRGEAVLAAGWHALDLVVCDPQFWNINSLEPMPFAVTYRVNGGDEREIASNDLRREPQTGEEAASPDPIWHEAAHELPRLETGVRLHVFDRTGKRRDPDFLDVEGLTPMRSEESSTMEPNSNASQARCYEGYFQAPADGIYTFDLPRHGRESAGLGALQAACQNQMRIDGEIVVQHGIAGRNPTREVGLKAGWHPVSIRFGPSDAPGSVTYPDGQEMPLTAASLSRPVLVRILPLGETTTLREHEIFSPTQVTLSLGKNEDIEIRYTLDGKTPGVNSTRYTDPLLIDKTVTITACAFARGRALTAPAQVAFKRVDLPEAELLGHVTFEQWNGAPGQLASEAKFGVWVLPDAAPDAGRHGKAIFVHHATAGDSGDQEKHSLVDVNVSRGLSKAGFKFSGIPMRENSISVAVWFKTTAVTGKLFGKEGYNAFGKSYKTVSCALAGGRLVAGPGKLTGDKIEPNNWQHVVLTGDEHQLTLYLNGGQVATGPGSPTLSTDALDFFTDHPAIVDSVRLYNRVLSPRDVKQLFRDGRSLD